MMLIRNVDKGPSGSLVIMRHNGVKVEKDQTLYIYLYM